MVLKSVLWVFENLKTIFLSLLVWIFVAIPVGVLAALPMFLLRASNHLLAKIFRPDLIPGTKVEDTLLTIYPSSMEPGMNASQVWRLKGKFNVDEFRQHFKSTFFGTEELREKYRNLSCCIVQWLFYCFKKPLKTVDWETQIRLYRLEEGVTLEGFVGKWIAQGTYGVDPGDKYREVPDWEILIIHDQANEAKDSSDDGLEQVEGSVVLFKISHCLCDGYSFIHIVEKLTGIKTPYNYKEKAIPLFDTIKMVFTGPKVLLEFLVRNYRAPDLLYPPKNPSPPEWFISFTTLDLKVVKEIRAKTKSFFNSVIQAAFIGALRRHFLESSRVSSVPELPVTASVSNSLGWPDHPAMSRGGMTNHLSIGIFQVPLRTDDPVERLALADEDYGHFHDVYLNKLVHCIVLGFLWTVPAAVNRFARRHGNFGILRCSMIVSPLMCSSEVYQLMGHPVDFLYLPLLARSGDCSLCAFVIPVSHSRKIDLTINASSELVKGQAELDRLTQVYFIEEIDKLSRALSF